MNTRSLAPVPHMQRGLVLPTVLILLLALTIVSLIITTQITTQTRMARNAAANGITLEAAEAVLRGVIFQLQTSTPGTTLVTYTANPNLYATTAPSATGLYNEINNPISTGGSTTPLWQTTNNFVSSKPGSSTALCPVSTPAVTSCQYMVELLPSVCVAGNECGVSGSSNSYTRIYRITARVVGPDGQSVVMLQTLFQSSQ